MSKWPSHLLLIRHGESELNVQREEEKAGKRFVLTGMPDHEISLTPRGILQARETGRYIVSQVAPHWDAILFSPYYRTEQTAECLCEEVVAADAEHPPRMVHEVRIREKEFGVIHGLTKAEIAKFFPQEKARKERQGKYYYRPPGGENYPDVELRVHSLLGTLTRDYVGANAIVVCHSVVILCFRRLLERMTAREVEVLDDTEGPENCSLTLYRTDEEGRLRLAYYNRVVWEEAVKAAEGVG